VAVVLTPLFNGMKAGIADETAAADYRP
jgi:hypothetical protein